MTDTWGEGGADPLNHVEWRPAGGLVANDWNPNFVMNVELRLLERSILRQGWIQPIIVSADGLVIDGFHRWKLAMESQPIRERYSGMVPVVVMALPVPEAMMLTIRINRAKGSHAAFRMAAVVKRLIDQYGYDPQQIAQDIGANLSEVELLYQDSIFKARNIADYRYSEAWKPVEIAGRKGDT